MTESLAMPFYRSFLLNGRNIALNQLDTLTDDELNMLNVETLAALEEARTEYYGLEDKSSERANFLYGRLKLNGYFQAAIKIYLQN